MSKTPGQRSVPFNMDGLTGTPAQPPLPPAPATIAPSAEQTDVQPSEDDTEPLRDESEAEVMTALAIHSAAKLFPEMADADFDALVRDIDKNGVGET